MVQTRQITVTGFTASSLSLVAPADMEVGSDHHPLFLDGPFGWSSHLYSANYRTIISTTRRSHYLGELLCLAWLAMLTVMSSKELKNTRPSAPFIVQSPRVM